MPAMVQTVQTVPPKQWCCTNCTVPMSDRAYHIRDQAPFVNGGEWQGVNLGGMRQRTEEMADEINIVVLKRGDTPQPTKKNNSATCITSASG